MHVLCEYLIVICYICVVLTKTFHYLGNGSHNFPPVNEEYKNQEHAHFGHRNMQATHTNMGQADDHMDMDMGGDDHDMEADHMGMDMDMDMGGDDHDMEGDAHNGSHGHALEGPASVLWYPLFDEFYGERRLVAMLAMTVTWDSFFLPSVPPNSNGILVVISNTCGQAFTYEITGPEVIYLGAGDLHEEAYDRYVRSFDLANPGSSFTGIPLSSDYCPFNVKVYPSEQMEEQYKTNEPLVFTVGIASIFVFTVVVFSTYDWLVERRQRQLAEKADKSSAIISSLFPEVVRDRLFQGASGQKDPRSKMNQFMASGHQEGADARLKSAPIADLFPDATVMFGDIAGFTAWASSREPAQVFSLLETLYGA
jgi:hypothetical protein